VNRDILSVLNFVNHSFDPSLLLRCYVILHRPNESLETPCAEAVVLVDN